MIIKYTNFSNGIHELKFIEPVHKLGLEEMFFGDVELECRMDKSPHQIVLDCKLVTHAKMVCDRCAVEFEEDLRSEFQLSYMFAKNAKESDELNFKILTPDEDKIDLSEDVFEYAELAVPMKRLCDEDCKGLCLKCGINLNEAKCNCVTEISHDVWAPLKELKDKLNN